MEIFHTLNPECDKLHCMKNLNGRCVHRVCPMTDPNYKSPELVAREVEKRYRDNGCQQEFEDSLLGDDEPQYDDDYEQD